MSHPEKSFAVISLILAFIVATFTIAVLSLLTLGFAGVVLAVAMLMATFIAIQYLVWGWWLGDWIRRQQDRNEE